ncbi:hypothetical protein EDB85DRAFT_1900011 [Lactarius pseudohatsudake]|nr:hypothetical protein EDB85DRAFT_1900011 [Lactarius pseudohatsudake]
MTGHRYSGDVVATLLQSSDLGSDGCIKRMRKPKKASRSQQVRKRATEYGRPDGGGREGKGDMSWFESENAETVREEGFWPGNAQLAGRPLRFTGRNGEKLRSWQQPERLPSDIDRGRDRAGTGREVWKAANYRKDSDSAGVKSGGMVGVGWPGESAPAGVLNVLISDDPGKLTCVPVGTTRMEPGR